MPTDVNLEVNDNFEHVCKTLKLSDILVFLSSHCQDKAVSNYAVQTVITSLKNAKEKEAKAKWRGILLAVVATFGHSLGEESSSRPLYELCASGCIDRGELYLAVAAWSSLKQINTFADWDCYCLQDAETLCKGLLEPHRKVVMTLFLFTQKKRRHWLPSLVGAIGQVILEDNLSLVEELMDQAPLRIFWPILLLQLLKQKTDISALQTVVNHVLELETEPEHAFTELAYSLKRQIEVLLWVKKNTSKSRPIADLNNQPASTLLLMHQSCLLNDLCWDSTHKFLEENTGKNAGHVALWELATWDAFWACILAFDSIIASLDVDWEQESKKRIEELYRINVVERLEKMQCIICQLQPVTLRVEVLEKVFSLLFLRFEDFHQENRSDSGGEEDIGIRDERQPVTSFSMCELTSSSLQSIPSIPAQVALHRLSTATNAAPMKPHDERLMPSSLPVSFVNCNDSGAHIHPSSHRRHGFICGRHVLRDVISTLQACLVTTSAAHYSSLSEESSTYDTVPSSVKTDEIQQRINLLNIHVTEAMWRLEVLTSTEFVNEVGEVVLESAGSSTPSSPDWLYPYSLDEDSASDDEVPGMKSTPRGKILRRRRSDTEKSSESGSQSNPTSAPSVGTSKWSRRNRRKSSDRPYSSGTRDNTVKRMLSSKTSLVAQCLAHSDVTTAKCVIELLQMENMAIATEVRFLEAYCQLQDHLTLRTENNKNKHKYNSKAPQQSSTLKAIQKVASAGVQTSTLNNEVENLLTSSSLPCVPDADRIPSDMLHLVGGAPDEQPAAIAAADLALMVATTCQQALSFLGIASKYCQELRNLHTTQLPRGASLGFLPLIQNLLLSTGQLDDESPVEVFLHWDVQNFLTRSLRDSLLFWNSLQSVVNEVQPSCTSATFHQLVQIASSSPLIQFHDGEKDFLYLQELYSYLKELFHVARRGQSSAGGTSTAEMFDVLAVNPLSIFSMMFTKENTLKNLEMSVGPLGCNLPHLLALHLSSDLLVTPYAALPQNFTTEKRSSIFVLNGGAYAGPARHPFSLVQELLSLLLEELSKQWCEHHRLHKSKHGWLPLSSVDPHRLQNILSGTWELTAVNLEVMQPGFEILCFYTNLANLMWIHSLVQLQLNSNEDVCNSLVWGSPVEQIAAQNSLHYCIGGLGFVSLWEVRQRALGTDLVFPRGTPGLQHLASSVKFYDPRVLFAISTGTSSSPKIQVYHTENFESKLKEALQDYVHCWVHIDSGQIIVPSLLWMYLQHTGADVYTFIMNHCQEEFEVSSDVEVTQLIENNLDIYLTLSYSSTPKETFSLQPISKHVPKLAAIGDILKYLKECCPLLEVLLCAIHSDMLLSETDSDEEPQEGLEADDTTAVVEAPSFKQFKILERLCSSLRVIKLAPLFGSNVVLTALNDTVPLHLIWNCMDSLVEQNKWVDILEILQALPSPQIHGDLRLMAIHDLALMELTLKSKDYCEPWHYCERITSLFLRVRCVLAGCVSWPGSVCQEQLQAVLHNQELDALPNLQQEASRLLHSINVYQQIINLNYNGPWLTWQEVSKISKSEPVQVLNQIISLGNAQLCLSWMNLHSVVTSLPHLIDDRLLAVLLDGGSASLNAAEQILRIIPLPKSARLCLKTLHRLRTISSLQFCVQFLHKVCRSELTESDLETLKLVTLGIQMVEVVSEYERVSCLELVMRPHLMLEQLVMNMQLEAAEQMLNRVRSQLQELSPKSPLAISAIDLMLRQYASKSLEFSVAQSSPASMLSENNTLSASVSSNSGVREFVMPSTVPSKADWTPNEQASVCMNCEIVAFSMFNRRHHCRRCGRVVCATCSSNKLKVTGYGSLKVRVCDSCNAQSKMLTETESVSPSGHIEVTPPPSESPLPADNHWRLSESASLNAAIREEFAYEQHAPSVSLCLSILKLHSEHVACPTFLMDSCERILSYLQPQVPGVPNPEVDHALVIEMCRSLVLAAKVKCAQSGLNTGVLDCDELLSKIDLLDLLVSHGCMTLIPKQTNIHALRLLRNQLLEEELWELALEVSTKRGLERSGVWAAWGKGCLRAGRWQEAREKFAQCLPRSTKGTIRPTGDSPLLLEILQILESTPHVMDNEILQQAETLRASSSHLSPAPAVAILHSLSSLKNITLGKLPQLVGARRRLEPIVYSECCYYLREYGSHATYLDFLVRHADLTVALKHTLSNAIDPQLFFDWVYLPCLRTGQITPLHSAMTAIDSSLRTWKNYLHGICAALERRKLLHTLYEVQQWSKDHVRAAMTCIRFYHHSAWSYTQLADNLNYLMRAQSHLEAALAVASVASKVRQAARKTDSGSGGSGVSDNTEGAEAMWLQLSPQELDHHLSTVCRQVELTKFFCACEAKGKTLLLVSQTMPRACTIPLARGLPTLFGNPSERRLLAAVSILCGKNVEEGFGLAFRIIESFNLNAQEIYEVVATSLVSCDRIMEIQQLLECIRSSGASDVTSVCDSVLSASVSSLPEQCSAANVDFLVRGISSQFLKVRAYISCGQLKSAYLLAVKHPRPEEVQHDVERILKEAERRGQTAIQKICLKRLGRVS